MDSINLKLAKTIYFAREKAGYTQKEVAQAVSVSLRFYQRVEKGEKLPGAIVFLKLLLYLNIDVESFREYIKFTK